MPEKGSRKGDSYQSVHRHIAELYGTPGICEMCGRTTKCHWANITGVYTSNRENWKRMCVSCHRTFDFTEEHKLVLTRKGIKSSPETRMKQARSMRIAWKEGRHKPNLRGSNGQFRKEG